MDVVDDFVARYRREYDFYSRVADVVARMVDAEVQAAGIRCIVTHRAKSPSRLEEKCRQRARSTPYDKIDDLYADIVDLAGVRIALYFSAERDQVDHIITRLFVQARERREFPTPEAQPPSGRFAGYSAVHYLVQVKETGLADSDKRYSDARVEVQVASVLMHAWAEVNHDLVYKPLQGELSTDEYSLLDQLNGLVMAGEICLEQIQKAGEARVAVGGRHFANHYELAAHLLGRAQALLGGTIGEAGLGRIDLLYRLLTRLELNTPDALAIYLDALHGNLELRPIADQIIDSLLSEDEARYGTYEDIRAEGQPRRFEDELGRDVHQELGYFLAQWIRLETLLRERQPAETARRPMTVSGRLLESLGVDNRELRVELGLLRRLRNNLVHGVEVPSPDALLEAAQRLEWIVNRLEGELSGRDR